MSAMHLNGVLRANCLRGYAFRDDVELCNYRRSPIWSASPTAFSIHALFTCRQQGFLPNDIGRFVHPAFIPSLLPSATTWPDPADSHRALPKDNSCRYLAYPCQNR